VTAEGAGDSSGGVGGRDVTDCLKDSKNLRELQVILTRPRGGPFFGVFFENVFWTLPVGHSTGLADRGQGASGARGATRVTCFGVLRVLRVPPEYPPVPRGYGVGSKKNR
jgi:hypothetical protein